MQLFAHEQHGVNQKWFFNYLVSLINDEPTSMIPLQKFKQMKLLMLAGTVFQKIENNIYLRKLTIIFLANTKILYYEKSWHFFNTLYFFFKPY